MSKNTQELRWELKVEMGLLEICQAVHMTENGSADPLTEEEEQKFIAILENARDNWDFRTEHHDMLGRIEMGNKFYSFRYDMAVLALIEATLNQYWAGKKEDDMWREHIAAANREFEAEEMLAREQDL